MLATDTSELTGADVGAVKDEALRAVNGYFERRLLDVPSIRGYLEELGAGASAG